MSLSPPCAERCSSHQHASCSFSAQPSRRRANRNPVCAATNEGNGCAEDLSLQYLASMSMTHLPSHACLLRVNYDWPFIPPEMRGCAGDPCRLSRV